ncbi:transcriptional repressor TCF25-domain-containing protein [Endogone sp. FLAS-F59071]|nr:transcriptional repressor TCF25-domain-containing protein [Endogone sp. FLAS-F59071]|eukprot:RUS22507.1 transcriptional repressor TCF25-domain-containing protein [Endogone sp. FLAS-F59071]
MDLFETIDGISHFAFTHSAQYQDVQYQFFDCVATHDPNTLVGLLQRNPYHVDCLLQLSEVAKHSGDWQMAGEFIERALYAFERAFHTQFNITSGSVRLAYKRMENRSFFLAIYRHVQFLARRGCWRTAFEFNKLLLRFVRRSGHWDLCHGLQKYFYEELLRLCMAKYYCLTALASFIYSSLSLDPTTDPVGSLLSIDFHALKAHEYAYFLRLHSHFNVSGSLSLLPSYAYSAAYAQFKQESDKGAGDAEGRHEGSIKLLQRAVCLFPGVVIPLMEKCGEKDSRVLDNAVLLACHAESPYLNLLIQLFVERNFALWKEPEVISWLKATTLSTISLLESATDPLVQEGLRLCTTDFSTTPIPLNLSRHVLISDYQSLLHFLPSEVTSQSYHMYDPLPPLDSVSPYGNESGNGAAHDPQGMLMVMLRNLLPWGDQAAAGRDAGPGMMNGQGIRMRELAEQIEAFAAARGAANDGRVPGEFPGDEENAETMGEARDVPEGLDE